MFVLGGGSVAAEKFDQARDDGPRDAGGDVPAVRSTPKPSPSMPVLSDGWRSSSLARARRRMGSRLGVASGLRMVDIALTVFQRRRFIALGASGMGSIPEG